MKKIFIIGIVFMFLVSFVSASDECSGFWGSVKCLLWGDPNFKVNIAGEAVSSGNLVGEASGGNIVGETDSRGNLVGEAKEKTKSNSKNGKGSKIKKSAPAKEIKKDVGYTCKGDDCTPDKGYSWANDKDAEVEGGLMVQKDPTGDYVTYEDINGNYFSVKEENGGLKYYSNGKWEKLETVFYTLSDSNAKATVPETLKEFMEGKLAIDGQEQTIPANYFSDGGNSEVVKKFMQDEFKKQVGDDVYKKYVDLVNWKDFESNFKEYGKKLTLKNSKGIISVSGEEGKVKAVIVKGTSKELNGATYVYQGKILASSSESDKASGKVRINGQEVYVKEVDSDVNGVLSDKEIFGYASKEDIGKADAVPVIGVEAKEDKITMTQYQEGTRTIEDLKQQTEIKWEGDYYQGGKSEGDCKDKQNCLIYNKGTFVDMKTGKVLALLDADTKGMGKDQKLVRVEMYDPQSGRRNGEIYPNGGSIIAIKDDTGKYTGEVTVTKSKEPVTYKRDEQGKWKNGNTELDKTNAEKADAIQSSTTGFVAGAQTVLESYYAITNSIKSYPALSKLLFKDLGGTTAVEDWQRKADQTFAPMLGGNWFPSAVCEGRTSILGLENSNTDINSKGKQFIKTVSGTYQGVGSVQGERSADKSPLLCYANPDTEAKIKYICDEGQVCKEDGFCYANEDAEKPLQGYFYKITWAVSAPQDEKLTPLVDENGVAVTFNIVLKDASGTVIARLYRKDENSQYPIELNNGAKDRDMIVHYSERVFKEVCIEWGKKMKTVTTLGTEDIPNICFEIEQSLVGKSAWESSVKNEGSGATTSVSNGKVSKNTQW